MPDPNLLVVIDHCTSTVHFYDYTTSTPNQEVEDFLLEKGRKPSQCSWMTADREEMAIFDHTDNQIVYSLID